MEEILHSIQELQRIADDLATDGGAADVERYEADCEMFLGRMEGFISENCPEHLDYLTAKVSEVRSNLLQLMRQGNSANDPMRYQSLVNRGLDGVYRCLRNPSAIVASEAEYD